jgi:AbiV family abortive infection protein
VATILAISRAKAPPPEGLTQQTALRSERAADLVRPRRAKLIDSPRLAEVAWLPVKARQLIKILNLPEAQRFGVIAEGLSLLAEHVGTLHSDLLQLMENDRPRSAAVVDSLASEEAAKMLILLDVVRMGWADQDAVRRQIKYFYNHLARGIYAWVASGRPADLKEIRGYADSLRRSLYLDGPNDVDWIFRNEIVAEREETLYVDYLAAEHKNFWTTPASRDRYQTSLPNRVVEIAVALDRIGCTKIESLEIISRAWQGVTINDKTHWTVVKKINRQIFAELQSQGLAKSDLTRRHLFLAEEHWTFPLTDLALDEIKVTSESLQAKRESWLGNYG